MTKNYVPFDKFERDCAPESKSLHETMQESCVDALHPPERPCKKPCVPHWQATDKTECLDVGLVAVIEDNGCGQTRTVHTSQRVVWTNTEETRCNELQNRIEAKQINQCGGERWVTTFKSCCVPIWVNDPNSEPLCDGDVERRVQIDGCGNQRLRVTGNPINWVSTGQTQCDPGDVYRIEQRNQCGDSRWITVEGGCPCIPNWQSTGLERCTSTVIEAEQHDGCGGIRWQPTTTPVNWVNTGNTRCNGSFVQNEQTSQCGTTRWHTTNTPCTNSPPANQLELVWNGALFSGKAMDGPTSAQVLLDATSGMMMWSNRNSAQVSEPWVSGAFNREDYEARITMDEGTGDVVSVTGSQTGIWFDLGDTTLLTKTITITGPNNVDRLRQNIFIRIDIRKKGEPISGGKTFGPFSIKTT